jgi:hypothetical protein
LWAEEEVEMRDERCAGGEDDGLVSCDVMRGCGCGVPYCRGDKEKEEEEIYVGFDVLLE